MYKYHTRMENLKFPKNEGMEQEINPEEFTEPSANGKSRRLTQAGKFSAARYFAAHLKYTDKNNIQDVKTAESRSLAQIDDLVKRETDPNAQAYLKLLKVSVKARTRHMVRMDEKSKKDYEEAPVSTLKIKEIQIGKNKLPNFRELVYLTGMVLGTALIAYGLIHGSKSAEAAGINEPINNKPKSVHVAGFALPTETVTLISPQNPFTNGETADTKGLTIVEKRISPVEPFFIKGGIDFSQPFSINGENGASQAGEVMVVNNSNPEELRKVLEVFNKPNRENDNMTLTMDTTEPGWVMIAGHSGQWLINNDPLEFDWMRLVETGDKATFDFGDRQVVGTAAEVLLMKAEEFEDKENFGTPGGDENNPLRVNLQALGFAPETFQGFSGTVIPVCYDLEKSELTSGRKVIAWQFEVKENSPKQFREIRIGIE